MVRARRAWLEAVTAELEADLEASGRDGRVRRRVSAIALIAELIAGRSDRMLRSRPTIAVLSVAGARRLAAGPVRGLHAPLRAALHGPGPRRPEPGPGMAA
jgi:hypothetical protein